MFVSLGDALDNKRIIVCVGAGGVGKTTTAAALAVEAARRGKRTLVLTIDPAKRLANSLGLDQLGHTIQRVDPALVLDGSSGKGELHAMMLDQKSAFDEVVSRYAKDASAVQRILGNPVYAQISSTLAGAHEYAAMAKLEELDATGEWELIVVDTPPTRHALDFLEAPAKLAAAIESPAIEWFRKLRDGKSGWSLIGRSGSFVLKRLARFVGVKFLEDLGVFFAEFNDVLAGFRERAERTYDLLRQPRVGFVLVASPEPLAIDEAKFFISRLNAAAMPLAAMVINRVHPSAPTQVRVDRAVEQLAGLSGVSELALSRTSLRIAAEAMIAAHADIEALAATDRQSVARLREHAQGLCVLVPFLREDVHDVARLIELGRYLVASPPGASPAARATPAGS